MAGAAEPGPGEGAALAVLALDAGRMASWRWDVAANMVTGDDRLAALYGFEPGHWPIPLGALTAAIHPGDADRVAAAILASLEEGADYEEEFRVRRTPAANPEDPGGWRWLRGRGHGVEPGEDGKATALLGVNWDVSDTKASDERMAMMAAEMDHRVKNAFAIMRALINIGRRRATDLPSFADDLGAQVQAMADAHGIAARLARQGGDPRPVIPVAEVIETALAPWAAADPARIATSLHPRLALPALKVSALSMLIQELTTNAAKHGALRDADGRLSVTVEETRRGGLVAARLVWNEVAATPLGAPNADRATSGFGDVLIEHCLAALNADEERDLRPEGLKLVVVLPLDRA